MPPHKAGWILVGARGGHIKLAPGSFNDTLASGSGKQVLLRTGEGEKEPFRRLELSHRFG